MSQEDFKQSSIIVNGLHAEGFSYRNIIKQLPNTMMVIFHHTLLAYSEKECSNLFKRKLRSYTGSVITKLVRFVAVFHLNIFNFLCCANILR